MTLPPSLQPLDDLETETEPELTRISLLIGSRTLDVGVPANVDIAAFMPDVLRLINDQIISRASHNDETLELFDVGPGRWTLARLGQPAVDDTRSLEEAGFYEGDVLTVRRVGEHPPTMLFDDVDDDDANDKRRPSGSTAEWSARGRRVAAFGVAGIATLGLLALLVFGEKPPLYVPIVAAIAAALLILSSAYTSRALDDETATGAAVACALPLVFAGSLRLLPDSFGSVTLPMAFGITALVSFLAFQISGRNRTLHALVLTLTFFLGGASVFWNLLDITERQLGAVLAVISVITVSVAPRLTILLAKLPVPPVPTAGEPIDDIDTRGEPTVQGVNAVTARSVPTADGLNERIARANAYLTGILAGAAFSIVVGVYFSVDTSTREFYWQGTVFATLAAAVLCLRGRTHHDLYQSATMVGLGLIAAIVIIVKSSLELDDWMSTGFVLIVMVGVLAFATGIVAPRFEFSPITRRYVEILEYVLIGLMLPFAAWIMSIYSWARGLDINF
ncbi:type VII secretion integral membrane protein EccD [Gordonia sp. ABSL1-1]|uniref:type VII secretion integral membrane protein EccD n=1 Tax=Gordonia sp. ABSL1-1 TaxID=3053923 RepID=UPI002572766B|nr:type VII secretion integral membrane protein EccD [Gordonia sp. ABSL1-1]MDL9937750.1 type VII secretion integral membrane protein EccD [Gordonia sp. ABSL1-1]